MTRVCDCGCGRPARARIVVRRDERLSEEKCEKCSVSLALPDDFSVHVFDENCSDDSDANGWNISEWWSRYAVIFAIIRICKHCGHDNYVFHLDADVTDITE